MTSCYINLLYIILKPELMKGSFGKNIYLCPFTKPPLELFRWFDCPNFARMLSKVKLMVKTTWVQTNITWMSQEVSIWLVNGL